MHVVRQFELLIGVYRTEDSAKAAIERVKGQPGFEITLRDSRYTNISSTKIFGRKDSRES